MTTTTDRRRRLRVSARVRILTWVVVLLALAGTAALLLQRRVLLTRLADDVAATIDQEVEEMRVLATEGIDPQTGEPFGGDVAALFDTFLARNIPVEGETLVTFVAGRPYKATSAPIPLTEEPGLLDRWAAVETPDRGSVTTAAGEARFVAVPLVGSDGGTAGVFVVAAFIEDDLEEIDQATRVGALVYGGVLLVAISLGWVVAGRVLAPLRDVTETAAVLSDTDLTRRIDVPDSNDEIADLARVFNAMLDRLEGGFVEQRRFLDDAGHELRTPITIIRGHLELEGDDPAERAATRAIVLDELDRMGRIVEDLLVLARAEQPDAIQPEPVDLDLLTTELFDKARALADRDWQLVATGAGVLEADRHRLTQAVVNLLDNAVRHTGPGDRVELGSRFDDGWAHLWVHDTGPGVPADQQARIFRRFARAGDGRRVPGTAGLGLAIVAAIATAHGGTATVDSTPGEGATFTISIPDREV